MFPKWHILFGAIFALGLHYFYNIGILNSIVVFFASVLIDVDHYIYYIWRKKDFSLKNSYRWFVRLDKKYYGFPEEKKKKYWYAYCILHSIELAALLVLLSFFPELFFLFFVALGFLFHLLLDFLFKMHRDNDPFDIISLIYKSIKIKNQINLEKFVK